MNRLPLAVSELDILIIKPGGSTSSEFARRPEFQVKRSRLVDNLKALQHFHPDYQCIQINWEVINALPEDGSVLDQLGSVTVEDLEDSNDNMVTGPPNEGEEHDTNQISEAVIPNVGPRGDALGDAQSALNAAAGIPLAQEPQPEEPMVLTGPQFRPMPINEHDPSNQFLSRAFPFLFPTGEADLNHLRDIKVNDGPYFKHLLHYKDGRFARHPRFR